jgi:hypothetical protein
MPNGVKYSTTTPSGSLRRDNVALGVNGNLGPTANTGFYSMPTPASGKYIINKVAASGVPNFFAPQNDTELIQFARNEGATGANTGSAAAVLSWIATQPNLEAANFEYENIVTDGLVLNLDAGFVGSYPTINTTWYDISGNNNSGSLVNSPTFNSANSGSIVFDGVDDYVTCGTSIPSLVDKVNITACLWIKFNPELEVFNLPIGKYGQGQSIGWEGFWFNDGRVAFGGRESSAAYLYTGESSAVCPAGSNIYNVVYHKSGSLWSVYVNGTSVISTSLGLGNVSMYNSSAQLEIGRAEGSYNVNCNIYISQVYNRALTQTEITQNYNAQKGRFGL